MEVHPHPLALTHHQLDILVVPPLRCVSGIIYAVATTPTLACLATESADEINPGATANHRHATIARRDRGSCAIGAIGHVHSADAGSNSQCNPPIMLLMSSFSVPAHPV